MTRNQLRKIWSTSNGALCLLTISACTNSKVDVDFEEDSAQTGAQKHVGVDKLGSEKGLPLEAKILMLPQSNFATASDIAVKITGEGVDSYKYAILLGESCAEAKYSEWKAVAENVVLTNQGNGKHSLCVLTKSKNGDMQVIPSQMQWDSTDLNPIAQLSENYALKTQNKDFSFKIQGLAATHYRFRLVSEEKDCVGGSYSEFFEISNPIVLSNVSDGKFALCLSGKSSSGKIQSTPTAFSWEVDTVPPIVAFSGMPEAGLSINNTFYIEELANENLKSIDYGFSVGLSSASCNSITLNKTHTTLSSPIELILLDAQQGTVTLCLRAVDEAGNISTVKQAQWQKLPAASFVTQVSSAAPLSNNPRPTWTWVALGSSPEFRLKLDDSDLSTGATLSSFTSFSPSADLSAGTHTLYVQEKDVSGNWSTQGSFAINIDTSAPTAPVLLGSVVTNDTTPTWSWTSGGGGGNGTFRYKLNDAVLAMGATETTSTDFTPSTALSTGHNILYVQERDATGNWSPSSTFTIRVNAAPTLSSAAITPSTAYLNSNLTCTPAGYADVDGDVAASYAYVWTKDGTDISGATSSTLSGGLLRGNVISCRVFASDGFANSNTVTSSSVTIQNTNPTISSVTLSTSAGTPVYPAHTLTCSAAVTDADGDSVTTTFAWSGIAGSAANPYTVVAADIGNALQCSASLAANADGNGSGVVGAVNSTQTFTPQNPISLSYPSSATLNSDCGLTQVGTSSYATGYAYSSATAVLSGITGATAANSAGFSATLTATELSNALAFSADWTVNASPGSVSKVLTANYTATLNAPLLKIPLLPPSQRFHNISQEGALPAQQNCITPGSRASIATGLQHACVLMTSGKVKCWGENNDGRLGVGDFLDRTTPTEMLNTYLDGTTGKKGVALAASGSATCVLLDSGKILCTGLGGNLGQGVGWWTHNHTPSFVDTTQIDGTTGKKAIAISGKSNHYCALLDSGKVKCWGAGNDSQLGNGLSNNQLLPVDVLVIDGTTGKKAVAIAAGTSGSCAIMDTGKVKCWGKNTMNELGDTTAITTSTPVNVDETVIDGTVGKKAVAIAIGWIQTCAIMDTGKVKCWGFAGWGALGDGRSNVSASSPVDVVPTYLDGTPGKRATAITASGQTTCVLADSGRLLCWGFNGNNQFGDGGTVSTEIPTFAGSAAFDGTTSAKKAIALSASANDHYCALTTDGRLKCWGLGADYRLGTADVSNESTPKDVVGTGQAAGGTALSGIATGGYFSISGP